MPREMSEKYESAHRVVVKGPYSTRYYGPYAKAGTAKAILAKELRYHERYNEAGVFEGWVEKSSASWERVA